MFWRSERFEVMAYQDTKVPISQSQQGIRELVSRHDGTGISFMSNPPREGFEALVTIAKQAYHIRVMATCKRVSEHSVQGKRRAPNVMRDLAHQEERRVWRVLYFHLKAMFEAADSGVIAVEDIILPYIVTPDGRTIAEHVAPKLAELRELTHEKLLSAGGLNR
jgi:hypothetical protein